MNQTLWANATIIVASLFGQVSPDGHAFRRIPHFPAPKGYGIDHREPRRTSTETYRQHELFCSSFAAGPTLAFAAAKRCLQSGNRDLLGSPWFVAAGVLTAEMMMWGFDRPKIWLFPISDCD